MRLFVVARADVFLECLGGKAGSQKFEDVGLIEAAPNAEHAPPQ